jgi:hypothetical protein
VTASTIRAADRSQAASGTLADPARDLRAYQADAVAAVLLRVGGARCCQARGQADLCLERKAAR